MAKRDGAAEYLAQFLARVARARQVRGYTQDQIAILLGIDQPRYNKYEVRSYLPHHLVPVFCVACGVDVQWLFTGKGMGPAMPAVEPPAKRPRRRRVQRAA